MSPRTGRPIKGTQKKDVSLQLRISKNTDEKLRECANSMGISRTEVIELGIDKLYEDVSKKKIKESCSHRQMIATPYTLPPSIVMNGKFILPFFK